MLPLIVEDLGVTVTEGDRSNISIGRLIFYWLQYTCKFNNLKWNSDVKTAFEMNILLIKKKVKTSDMQLHILFSENRM